MTTAGLSIIAILLMISISSISTAIAQNERIQNASNTTSIYSHHSIQSPLIQYRSGIDVQAITCNLDLQLILKAEDGSPACVKPDTAQQLMGRGWGKSISTVMTTYSNPQCDGTVIPPGDLRTGMVPALIMESNSNATVCITYKFIYDWISYPNKDVYPHGIFETTCCNFDMTKFVVLSEPPLFNITGIQNEAKVTVMYKIHSQPNSTGFYSSSIPFGSCNSYPLAVGFNSSQINASDFPSYRLEIPCYNTIDKVDSVKIVSGMTYKEIQMY